MYIEGRMIKLLIAVVLGVGFVIELPTIISRAISNYGWLRLSQAVAQTTYEQSWICVAATRNSGFPEDLFEDVEYAFAMSNLFAPQVNESSRYGLATAALYNKSGSGFQGNFSEADPLRDGLGAMILGCAWWGFGNEQQALTTWTTGGQHTAQYLSTFAYNWITDVELRDALLRQSVLISPTFDQPRLLYGLVLIEQENWALAIDVLRLCYEPVITSSDWTVNQTRCAYEAGGALFKLQRLEEAYQTFSNVIERGKFTTQNQIAWAYHQHGQVAYHLGFEEQASSDFRMAYQISPGEEIHAIVLGQIMWRNGDEAGARMVFDQAIASSSHPETTIAWVGERLIWDGAFQAALDYFSLVDDGKANSEILGWKGVALARLGYADQAERLLASIIAENPTQPEWYETLAEIYIQQGKMLDAKEIYTQLILIQPDNLAAREFLQSNP